MGTYNVSHEQEIAEDSIREDRELDAVIALLPSTVEGTLLALDALRGAHKIKVIGFDSPLLPSLNSDALALSVQQEALDCVIEQDTRAIMQRAIELIQASLQNQAVPSVSTIPPVLITQENIQANLPQIREMILQERERIRSRLGPIQ